ncbi:DUF2062 domain-containing protein [Leptospira alexanderi]|uniref:PF09835 family protein n=1 Tax=Leptospira alexanderi serovar Manhao 3 str. L 60 TaxID=1049759 RepID=V6I8M1_9LEPT|nr:DUF2062 domain-containing protein [Leptospira alexanderi]EQA63529.1 PF09835 family protein [Leptospira alexanderi serovar Manhao 3 str. L 60]
MIKAVYRFIHQQVIVPFQKSHAPVQEVCLGTSIGLFWSLTPLVGIQMYLGLITWMLLGLIGIRFYMPISIAMIWITNPITFPFFYYIFYITGIAAYNVLGWNMSAMNFARISKVIDHSDSLGFYEGLKYWSVFLINDMGAPMFLGGFLIGVPSAIVGYPLTKVLLNGFRKKQATKEGISLKEWEDKYVRKEANKNVSIWNILKS